MTISYIPTALLALVTLLHAGPASAQARVAAGAKAPVAEPAATSRALVIHIPPSEARAARELRLVAVVDAAWTEAELVVRYRGLASTADYRVAVFERSSAGGYFATIPAPAMTRPGLEYYVAGRTPAGKELLHFASSERPHPVRVEPTQEVRWRQKEDRRLGGYHSTVSADFEGHNFGNRHAKDDHYVRGELEWTHRLLQPHIYSIALGYGFIEGRTPESADDAAPVLTKGARYGYGTLLLRFHRAVWFETSAALGVDRDEFIVGARAKLTLGRPWRSSVDLGVEGLENLGPSVWVRLQWDTVPPFLMGASIVKTDLPDASLSGGSLIAYDISYPITPRVLIRGSLSFGSRDGPANFGGGVGTAFSF